MILTMLLDILCTMGLPSVDDSLQRLLNAMQTFPRELGDTQSIAKLVGCGIALGVGSYEAWMMMLGRRGIDVMKILRIIILSICITSSGTICSAIKAPGESMEESAHQSLDATQTLVKQKEEQVAQLQKRYLDRLTFVQDSIYKAKEVAAIGEDAGTFRKILYNVQNLGATIDNLTKKAAVVAESKITEWINDVIRFIGQLIFQMAYYGMFVAQRCFMAMMQAFAPLMFALSLAPPWKSAWSQWMSKFISISLWGWGIYTVMLYVDYILMYNLDADIEAYTSLINGTDNSWGQIGALGLQGIGSNCMYAMGMLAGAFVLRMVPEVCSWLIPGGVSSGIGQAAGGVVASGAMMAGGASKSVARTTWNTVTGQNTVGKLGWSEVGTVAKDIGSIGVAAGKRLQHPEIGPKNS